MSLTVSVLTLRLGARLENPRDDPVVGGLAMPAVAASADVSFVLPAPAATANAGLSAAAVLVAGPASGYANALIVGDVLQACARSAAWLSPRRNAAYLTQRARMIAPTAVVAASAVLGPGVHIGEHSVIEAGVMLAAGVTIGAFCRIGAHAVIRHHAQIGNRVHIGAASVIGDDGFAFVRDGAAWLRMPAFASVSIEDDVVMLPQVVIHAGVFTDTVVGRGSILDSQVLIGHDSVVGANTAIAGQTAVAGAVNIGRGCRIGGKVGIVEGVVLADGVTVTGMSMVMRSITRAGSRYSSGWPAEPSTTWWRRVRNFRRATPRLADEEWRQHDS